jgi:hypothetical protein
MLTKAKGGLPNRGTFPYSELVAEAVKDWAKLDDGVERTDQQVNDIASGFRKNYRDEVEVCVQSKQLYIRRRA